MTLTSPPARIRRGLIGLLAAEAVSLVGSRMSVLALPWFVLVTTGSAAKTGLVAFAEMLPYVLACAVGGPLLDRLGPRRASVLADMASTAAVAAVPVLFGAGGLSLSALVGIVAAAGLLRGLGDTAKRTVFPQTVAAAGVDMTRATTIHDGINRLATLLGAPLAGVLIAVLSAPSVLLVDAGTFLAGAVIVAVTVPARTGARVAVSDGPAERYVAALRAGWRFVRRDRLMLGILGMLFATNLFDQAYGAVLAPVWARDVAGSAAALGALWGAFGLGAVLGNVAFTALAPRLPRFTTFAVGFLLGGAPRFLVAAAAAPWAVYAVTFIGGLFAAALNPILAAVSYERIPERLRSRVLGLTIAVSWAGIPLGGLLGGVVVDRFGLTASWVLFGGLYLAATLLPFLGRSWRDLDRRPAPATVPEPA